MYVSPGSYRLPDEKRLPPKLNGAAPELVQVPYMWNSLSRKSSVSPYAFDDFAPFLFLKRLRPPISRLSISSSTVVRRFSNLLASFRAVHCSDEIEDTFLNVSSAALTCCLSCGVKLVPFGIEKLTKVSLSAGLSLFAFCNSTIKSEEVSVTLEFLGTNFLLILYQKSEKMLAIIFTLFFYNS